MIEKTKWFSWKNGNLSKGCQLCVAGRKTVLFITGLCSKKIGCYYCPIADNRKNKDVIYANERPITKIEELYEEIKLCDSKGVGITGGDPLIKLQRTTDYIKNLKQTFGESFHIHLYCPLELVSEESLKKLYDAGLDELRFHIDIENKKEWEKIILARKFNWSLGVEIPVIPGKDSFYNELISFLKDKIDFLNLNELEQSDSESCGLYERGFFVKDDFSYAVKGSEGLALKLLQNSEGINVHYCTVKLKDFVQIPARLKHRLKNVKEKFDVIQGPNLVRGAIYLEYLKPSFNYRTVLNNLKDKEIIINKLKDIRLNLIKSLKLKQDSIAVDKLKLRLLISKSNVLKFKEKLKKLDLVPAIVEESPTYDQFEVEIRFI